MNATVSVIIPCYNGEKFIDQSVGSVYIQDYAPIELIVVDDGSTDSSAARIKAWESRFAEKGHTLKYVYQKNCGLGGAIDTGLKHVTGKYLTLLDADDIYLPGAIRKKAEFLESNPDYAGVRNNGWRVSGNDRWLFVNSDEEKQIVDLFSALSFGKTNNWAGTYMVRTSILFEAYPDRNINPSRLGQNFQILLPVAYRRKFGYVDEPLMEYRIQLESHAYSQDPEEQYRKSIVNSNGWRDIYCDIVNWVVVDPEERSFFMNGYDSVFYRAAMYRAISFGITTDIYTNYKHLKQTGYAFLDDQIAFYTATCSVYALPLRLVRRVKNIFHIK